MEGLQVPSGKSFTEGFLRKLPVTFSGSSTGVAILAQAILAQMFRFKNPVLDLHKSAQ